ncbi:hypothetical protein B0H21DRAFT_546480 [Amylocystis lapponica]|nr:hypothetical protein B0H21DRAFT_546480 [Amylocystis lapponica]
MSLDQNLFTLNIGPNSEDPSVVDLADPSGKLHYRKQRVPGSVYSVNVYDPLSESLLITATAPSATSKHKTLQLHNPDSVVELKHTGTLSFKWSFRWEEHDFEWKREECFILRKPDPSVLVAVTKESAGRLKTTSVQLLDYNLNRFDIQDRKGLEIVILTALLTFHDANEAYRPPPAEASSTSSAASFPAAASAITSFLGVGNAAHAARSRSASVNPPDTAPTTPPALPPRPAPRVGVERIAEMHMLRALQGEGEANEVEVGDEGSIDEYAQYAARLLKDEAMLFITVRSASPVQVPKVLRVVEESKRLRHKSGVAEDEELHQYVSYDTHPFGSILGKGPRRIKLDDPVKNQTSVSGSYAPPSSLVVHLSKIDMPELQPRMNSKERERRHPPKLAAVVPDGTVRAKREKGKDKAKEKGKDEGKSKDQAPNKHNEKEHKKLEKERQKTMPPRSQPNKSAKPTRPLSRPASARHTQYPPYVGRDGAKIPPPPSISQQTAQRSSPNGGPSPGPPGYVASPAGLLDWSRR